VGAVSRWRATRRDTNRRIRDPGLRKTQRNAGTTVATADRVLKTLGQWKTDAKTCILDTAASIVVRCGADVMMLTLCAVCVGVTAARASAQERPARVDSDVAAVSNDPDDARKAQSRRGCSRRSSRPIPSSVHQPARSART
jgi:hypothetical protein